MSIYYQAIGEGIPVVLLHGWAFHSEIWQPLIAKGKQDFCFHVVDIPGFGQSGDETLPENLSDVVERLLDYLPQQAIYLGWSLGGLLAIRLALDYSDRVTGLLALNSSPCFLQRQGWQGVSQEYFDDFYQQVEEHPEKVLKKFIMMGLVNREQQRRYFDSLWQLLIGYGFPKLSNLLTGLSLLKDNNLYPEISRIRCPVLFASTRDDPLTPCEARLNRELLDASGHFPLWTDADKVLKLLYTPSTLELPLSKVNKAYERDF